MNTGKPVNLEQPAPDPDGEDERIMDAPAIQPKREVRLGREVQARIGQQLRSLYDDVVKEGVPEHISALVRRLSEQDDGAA
jgi:hypothetical protein